MNIAINFTDYHKTIRLKKEGGKTLIFDPIRKKHLALAPEELVRQLVVQYLVLEKGFPKSLIGIEKGLKVNQLAKRCDILVYGHDTKPVLLAECKAPHVVVDEKTFEQIARYNLPLQVKYLLLTNGLTTYCCKMDYEQGRFYFLETIPFWTEINDEIAE